MTTAVESLNRTAVVAHHSRPSPSPTTILATKQQEQLPTLNNEPTQPEQQQQQQQTVPSIQLTSKPRQRFSEDDDRRIIKAVSDPAYCKSKGQRQSLLGIDASWTKIAREVFGGKFKRESIRTRYRRKLHPNLKQGRWTSDEDSKLLYLYGGHGSQWTTISAEMNFERNDLQCRDRYAMLVRKRKTMIVDVLPNTTSNSSKDAVTGIANAREVNALQQNGQVDRQQRQKRSQQKQKQQQSHMPSMIGNTKTSSSSSSSSQSPLSSKSSTSTSPLTCRDTTNPITLVGQFPPTTLSSPTITTSPPFMTTGMMYPSYFMDRSRTPISESPRSLTMDQEIMKDKELPPRLVDRELIKGVSDLLKLQKHSMQVTVQAQYQQLLYYQHYMAFQYHQQQQQQQQKHQDSYPYYGNPSYHVAISQQQQQQQHQQQQQPLGFYGMTSSPHTPMYSLQEVSPVSTSPNSTTEKSSSQAFEMSPHLQSPSDDVDTELTTPDSAAESGGLVFDVSMTTDSTQNLARGRGSYYYRGFKFTEGADSKLLAAINSPRYRINGGAEVDWSSIAKEEFQGNAAPSMLQRRYLRAMHPNLKQDEWTTEEDEKLLQLHTNHGGQWLTISEGMNFTRSDYQCRKRFQELKGASKSATAEVMGSATNNKHCKKRKISNTNPGELSEANHKSKDDAHCLEESLMKRIRCDENLDSQLVETMMIQEQQLTTPKQQDCTANTIHQVVENTMAEQPNLSL